MIITITPQAKYQKDKVTQEDKLYADLKELSMHGQRVKNIRQRPLTFTAQWAGGYIFHDPPVIKRRTLTWQR